MCPEKKLEVPLTPKKNARMKLLYSQLRVHYDGIRPLPQVEPRLGMNFRKFILRALLQGVKTIVG